MCRIYRNFQYEVQMKEENGKIITSLEICRIYRNVEKGLQSNRV